MRFGKNDFATNSSAIDSFDKPEYVHHVIIRSLKPETKYFFKINSDGKDFDNDGANWQTNTAKYIGDKPLSNLISGKVIKPSGLPIESAIIYVTVGSGSLMSTKVETGGNWIINISEAKTKTLDGYVGIEETTTPIEIFIQAGTAGVASVQAYPISAKPVPPIMLGQNLNLDNLAPTGVSDVPEAEIYLPLQN